MVFLAFHQLERFLFFGFDCHLELEFTPHLFTLLVEELGLLSVLQVPVVNIFIYLIAPLGRGHSDYFAMVHIDYLLVNVNGNEVVLESGLTRGAGVGASM